jgi:hypothetical protein
VLQLKEVAKPVPKDNQVLVKVQAASANALDWRRFTSTSILGGTAFHGGGQFGLLFQWLDSIGDSPYPCFSRKISMLPILNSENEYDPLCVQVPVRGLSPPLPGAALAS